MLKLDHEKGIPFQRLAVSELTPLPERYTTWCPLHRCGFATPDANAQ